ncbi:MFS transporter, DHA2 family, multidrug resistance protein [Arachidicoccus rhizosphaerae]|uniref:MFS transporter, DHA2 family, multidrug resistance protein n=1 Tax=Arachidicoccus rhizosphaerae TaxID=551991 RepID=A0A1H3WWR3_9BACT|nr:MFS transporter [Arachidicoccus rhizosphaerae]SDZ91181.1 MFS transporter, DHA2 family, multidrug resistance protein [Arachidicoccus rhizosphaerae]
MLVGSKPAGSSSFYKEVPGWLSDLSIFILLLSQSFVSGVSAYSISEVTSFLGSSSELIHMAFYASSIGLAAVLPLFYRIRKYMRRKRMWLCGLMLELILCLAAAHLSSAGELVAVSFLLGAAKCICLIDGIGILMARFNPGNSRGLFYGLYYSISYTGSQVAGYFAAISVLDYDWSYTYYIAIPGIIISMVIVGFLMHHYRAHRKVPIYQFDWLGMILFLMLAFCVCFIAIFGQRLDWWDAKEIRTASLIAGGSLIMFILKMLSTRRPYLNLSTLSKFPHTITGFVLMFLLYFVYNSSSVFSGFVQSVMGYDYRNVAALNLWMLPGFLIAIPMAGYLLHHHYRSRVVLAMAFLLFAGYYWMTYFLFYPEGAIHYFIIPQILKAAAYGMAITTLSYYASTNVEKNYNGDRAFLSVAVRYVFAAPVSASWFSRLVLVHTTKHFTAMTASVTADRLAGPEYIEGVSRKFMQFGYDADHARQVGSLLLHHKILKEATMLSARDIYLWLGVTAILVMLIILLIKKLDIHYLKNKNSYALLDA